MEKLNNKVAVSPSRPLTCSACGYSEQDLHKTSYNDAFADAQERLQKGERQKQCSECFRWHWEIKRDAPKESCIWCR